MEFCIKKIDMTESFDKKRGKMKNNSQPLVSIIMASYNRKYIIKRAIDSCINQLYENIEIIVCDDHSTDGTQEYIAELQKIEARIIYCKTAQGHKGANAARNAGIRIARGKYICFLDTDDELLPNGIIDRVDVFEKNPKAGMVYANALAKCGNKRIPWIHNTISQSKREARRYLLKELALCSQITIMVRKKVLDKIGPLNEEQRAWTDDGLVIAVGLNYPLVHCGKFVALVHGSEVSMTSSKYNLYQGLKVLVNKYKREIITEVSFARYIIWRVRLLSAWCYTKETSAKSKVVRFVCGRCRVVLRKIWRPFFLLKTE